MEPIFDWKIAIFALQFISTILTLGAFAVIKFNDFRHLSIKVKEIETNSDIQHKDNIKEFKSINKSLVRIEKAIIRRETICSMNHPRK